MQGGGRLSWPTWAQARIAILECAVLAVACMITYWLTRNVLTRVYSISRADAVTAAITTAVVMLVAAVTPRDAWEQPILRFADTLIGVAIGVGAAWIGLRLLRPRIETR